MKLSDSVYDLEHFDAARCVHMALGHTLAYINCHGRMGCPLSAHWQRCQILTEALTSGKKLSWSVWTTEKSLV